MICEGVGSRAAGFSRLPGVSLVLGVAVHLQRPVIFPLITLDTELESRVKVKGGVFASVAKQKTTRP